MDVLHSPGWKELFSELFDTHLENDIVVSLHHHKPGSPSGAPHNDYIGCWFVDDPLKNGMNPWFHQCTHPTNEQPHPDAYKKIRAIALIYYLSHEPWQEGIGGETGIYTSEDHESLYKKVEPVNNRLFAFHISPRSYHGFMKNHVRERNSIIQWFFQTPEIALAEHGEYPIQWDSGWNANLAN